MKYLISISFTLFTLGTCRCYSIDFKSGGPTTLVFNEIVRRNDGGTLVIPNLRFDLLRSLDANITLEVSKFEISIDLLLMVPENIEAIKALQHHPGLPGDIFIQKLKQFFAKIYSSVLKQIPVSLTRNVDTALSSESFGNISENHSHKLPAKNVSLLKTRDASVNIQFPPIYFNLAFDISERKNNNEELFSQTVLIEIITEAGKELFFNIAQAVLKNSLETLIDILPKHIVNLLPNEQQLTLSLHDTIENIPHFKPFVYKNKFDYTIPKNDVLEIPHLETPKFRKYPKEISNRLDWNIILQKPNVIGAIKSMNEERPYEISASTTKYLPTSENTEVSGSSKQALTEGTDISTKFTTESLSEKYSTDTKQTATQEQMLSTIFTTESVSEEYPTNTKQPFTEGPKLSTIIKTESVPEECSTDTKQTFTQKQMLSTIFTTKSVTEEYPTDTKQPFTEQTKLSTKVTTESVPEKYSTDNKETVTQGQILSTIFTTESVSEEYSTNPKKPFTEGPKISTKVTTESVSEEYSTDSKQTVTKRPMLSTIFTTESVSEEYSTNTKQPFTEGSKLSSKVTTESLPEEYSTDTKQIITQGQMLSTIFTTESVSEEYSTNTKQPFTEGSKISTKVTTESVPEEYSTDAKQTVTQKPMLSTIFTTESVSEEYSTDTKQTVTQEHKLSTKFITELVSEEYSTDTKQPLTEEPKFSTKYTSESVSKEYPTDTTELLTKGSELSTTLKTEEYPPALTTSNDFHLKYPLPGKNERLKYLKIKNSTLPQVDRRNPLIPQTIYHLPSADNLQRYKNPILSRFGAKQEYIPNRGLRKSLKPQSTYQLLSRDRLETKPYENQGLQIINVENYKPYQNPDLQLFNDEQQNLPEFIKSDIEQPISVELFYKLLNDDSAGNPENSKSLDLEVAYDVEKPLFTKKFSELLSNEHLETHENPDLQINIVEEQQNNKLPSDDNLVPYENTDLKTFSVEQPKIAGLLNFDVENPINTERFYNLPSKEYLEYENAKFPQTFNLKQQNIEGLLVSDLENPLITGPIEYYFDEEKSNASQKVAELKYTNVKIQPAIQYQREDSQSEVPKHTDVEIQSFNQYQFQEPESDLPNSPLVGFDPQLLAAQPPPYYYLNNPIVNNGLPLYYDISNFGLPVNAPPPTLGLQYPPNPYDPQAVPPAYFLFDTPSDARLPALQNTDALSPLISDLNIPYQQLQFPVALEHSHPDAGLQVLPNSNQLTPINIVQASSDLNNAYPVPQFNNPILPYEIRSDPDLSFP